MLTSLVLLIAMADDFDRLEGRALSDAANSADARAHESLTSAELGNLPNVLRDSRSALIVAKTDEGNAARMLVSPALRKPPKGGGEPSPILLVERLDTFEAGPATRRIARARDLILFDGFRLDLDSGQVVPEGQGGDLEFVAGGKEGPRLLAIQPLKMLTFSRSPLAPEAAAGRPSPGRSVKPGDFAGRYRIFANGQTSGVLEMKVGEGGAVTGRLTSDQTGGSYKVTGQAGADGPNRIRFAAALPRTRQEFEGLLFSEGKGAIAGSYSLIDRTFGFFAIREGGVLAPDGDDLGGKPIAGERPGKIAVEVTKEGYLVDGKPMDEKAMIATIREAVAREPSTWISLNVPDDLPAGRVFEAVESIRGASPDAVRLAPRSPARRD